MGFRHSGGGVGGTGVLPGPASESIDLGDVAGQGVSTHIALADHRHPVPAPDAAAELLDVAGSVGVSTRPAAMDHVHAHPAADHLAGGFADLSASLGATAYRQTTGAVAASGTADIVVDLVPDLPDANYTVTATVEDAGSDLRVTNIVAKAAGTVTIRVENTDAVNAATGTLHVVIRHDSQNPAIPAYLPARGTTVAPAATGVEATDTAALQAALDSLAATGNRLFVPDGIYATDGTLTTPAIDDLVIDFGSDAWLAPSAGWGLKVLGNFARHRITGAKVRIAGASTATRGVWVVQARRAKVIAPTVWFYQDIPAGFIGVDVDDNAYWCEIPSPTIRKDSAAYAGTLTAGVRFRNQSNAGRVIYGDINHCADGVQVDGSNAILVDGTAFEDVTNCVAPINATIAGNSGGLIVTNIRAESSTRELDLSRLTTAPQPLQIYSDGYGSGSVSQVNDPNNLGYAFQARGGVTVRDNDRSFRLRGGAVNLRDSSGHGIVEANGDVRINSDLDNNGAGDIVLQVGGTERARVSRSTGVLTVQQGLGHRTKAGVPTDADFPAAPPNGTTVIDTTNSRLYARIGGVWKFSALA